MWPTASSPKLLLFARRKADHGLLLSRTDGSTADEPFDSATNASPQSPPKRPEMVAEKANDLPFYRLLG
jgi:hypothetical protein